MGFLEELEWRGMLHSQTPGVAEALAEGMVTGYIGFDPTAPSLTIGNYVQLMILHHFQAHGHRPIVLMGGATGRIGDPSGKDKERELKTFDELDSNLEHQKAQMRRFLNFEEGENAAILVNNYDFYKDMNALDFLREVGKTLTVNYMMSKESVKRRIETGISFTEFSYQLLQGYDFQCLYEREGCTLQMGGSDQWGNITTGVEFVRRNLGAKVHAVTTPLLTKADGSKFGKSEAGNIWMDGGLTSPYQFYQFWLNADDRDLPKYFRYFSFKSREEIEGLESEHADDPRTLKRLLAEELTTRVHGEASLEAVQAVSRILFDKKANADTLQSLTADALAMVAQEIPTYEVARGHFQRNMTASNLLAGETSVVASNGELRRAIKGNAIAINKVKLTDHEHEITLDNLLHDCYLLVENGKKNKYLIVATD